MPEEENKESHEFPRGFNPVGKQGEYTTIKMANRTPFIYNKPLIIRGLALTLLAPVAIFLDLYKKTGLTFFLLFGIAYLSFPIYMLLKASKSPNIVRPDPSIWRSPSKLKASELITYTAIAFGLFVYATWQLKNGEFMLPTKGSRVIHLGGLPMYILAISFYCGALSSLLKVVDHWDERNNEHLYSDATLGLKWIAYIAFGASLLSDHIIKG